MGGNRVCVRERSLYGYKICEDGMEIGTAFASIGWEWVGFMGGTHPHTDFITHMWLDSRIAE